MLIFVDAREFYQQLFRHCPKAGSADQAVLPSGPKPVGWYRTVKYLG